LFQRRSAYLGHKRQRIAFGVFEESHPKFVIGHTGDHVRLVAKFNAERFHPFMSRVYVGHGEVKDRTWMIKFGFGGSIEHEASLPALQEGKIAGAEKQW
jgi:hypothetical protein